MSVNITLNIPTDVCHEVIQSGDCDRFISDLISRVGAEFLKVANLNASIPLTDAQQAELTGRAILGTWELQRGTVTAEYFKSTQLADTHGTYARSLGFLDYRNVPFDDVEALRDHLRMAFNKESAGMDLNEDMQKLNQTLWDPEESLTFAEQYGEAMKLDRDKGTISKLYELCSYFHQEGITSTEISHENVTACSVGLEGYIQDSIKQAKETQVRDEL